MVTDFIVHSRQSGIQDIHYCFIFVLLHAHLLHSLLELGDMVIFHIVILPACEIADTRYYRACVGGARETLCTCHKLFHNYLVIFKSACMREREPRSTNNQNNILSIILKN